jgi:hypothetical protein
MEEIMATAFTKKTKDDQLVSHTISSAVPHESTCDRCGGLMVTDSYMDLLNSLGESKFVAKRCVQCGEVVDSVILLNRQLRQNSMAVQLAGKMLPNNCVANGR